MGCVSDILAESYCLTNAHSVLRETEGRSNNYPEKRISAQADNMNHSSVREGLPATLLTGTRDTSAQCTWMLELLKESKTTFRPDMNVFEK